MSQKEILRRAFESGAKLTARQIRGVYKIKSPAKVISRLRRDAGIPVVSKKEHAADNRIVQKFRLSKPRYDVIVKGYEALFGAPPAKVLAAGYRVVGA